MLDCELIVPVADSPPKTLQDVLCLFLSFLLAGGGGIYKRNLTLRPHVSIKYEGPAM